MFDWLRKIIERFMGPSPNETVVFAKPGGPEPPTPQPKPQDRDVCYETINLPRWSSEKETEKLREERIKAEFLPSPKTKRKTYTHSYAPPAEQHRDAISKFMKGKAPSRYLRTIKQSPKIKINDEVED